MIKLYAAASCSSCDKARDWLDRFGLAYEEVNIVRDELSDEDLFRILSMTDNGTDDIISHRCKAYFEVDVDFEKLCISEMFKVLRDNRSLLKRPILLDDKHIQIGYNEDELRKFIPRDVRLVEFKDAYERIAVSK
jgi:regulatory protein spx